MLNAHLNFTLMHAARFLGFGGSLIYALIQRWSLQEFCWSTWLAVLFFSWTCIAVDSVRILLDFRNQKKRFQSKIPFLSTLSESAFLLLLFPMVLLAGWVMFYIYSYLFSFYGLFLSVWAEMEPHVFFGRNGFINSDFFSPVMYLLMKFWPMLVALILSDLDIFIQSPSWKLIFFPFRSGEIVRIHVMVVLMPFLCMIAWAIDKSTYQPVTIILLMVIFYLLQTRR